MNPSDQLVFDEILKLFGEFNRKFDEMDARWERRLSESRAAREPRVAAIEPRVDTFKRISAATFDAPVLSDNWGGQFDAPVVADNWGGLFEQPSHMPEVRDLDLSDALTRTPCLRVSPFAPAPDTAVELRVSTLEWFPAARFEAPVVADNWGGMFEQPAHDPEGRDLGLFTIDPEEHVLTSNVPAALLDAVQMVAIALPRGSKSSCLGSVLESDLAGLEQLVVDAAATEYTSTDPDEPALVTPVPAPTSAIARDHVLPCLSDTAGRLVSWSALLRLDTLVSLALPGNRLPGTLPDALPPRLRALDFSGAALSGGIPTSLASWESLTLSRSDDAVSAPSALSVGASAAAKLGSPQLELFSTASKLHVHLLCWEDSPAVENAITRASPLLLRTHDSVHARTSSVLDNPTAPAGHLQAALQAAQSAIKLAPDSIELAHFHAMLLVVDAVPTPDVSKKHASPGARQVFEVLSLHADILCNICIGLELLSHMSMGVNRHQPWPPPMQVEFVCGSAAIRPTPWPPPDCIMAVLHLCVNCLPSWLKSLGMQGCLHWNAWECRTDSEIAELHPDICNSSGVFAVQCTWRGSLLGSVEMQLSCGDWEPCFQWETTREAMNEDIFATPQESVHCSARVQNFCQELIYLGSSSRGHVTILSELSRRKGFKFRMQNEDESRAVVLLVFAYKQDLPHAMNVAGITDKLGLHSLRQRPWYIENTCAPAVYFYSLAMEEDPPDAARCIHSNSIQFCFYVIIVLLWPEFLQKNWQCVVCLELALINVNEDYCQAECLFADPVLSMLLCGDERLHMMMRGYIYPDWLIDLGEKPAEISWWMVAVESAKAFGNKSFKQQDYKTVLRKYSNSLRSVSYLLFFGAINICAAQTIFVEMINPNPVVLQLLLAVHKLHWPPPWLDCNTKLVTFTQLYFGFWSLFGLRWVAV